jgi:hypothetical protein
MDEPDDPVGNTLLWEEARERAYTSGAVRTCDHYVERLGRRITCGKELELDYWVMRGLLIFTRRVHYAYDCPVHGERA